MLAIYIQDAVEGSRPEEIMESTVDANEWKLEVERVTPSLKVHIRTDNKDWRTHVDQMHTHRDGINTALSETKVSYGGIIVTQHIERYQLSEDFELWGC